MIPVGNEWNGVNKVIYYVFLVLFFLEQNRKSLSYILNFVKKNFSVNYYGEVNLSMYILIALKFNK